MDHSLVQDSTGKSFLSTQVGKTLWYVFPRQYPEDFPEGKDSEDSPAQYRVTLMLLNCSSQEHETEVKHQEPLPSFWSASSPWDAQMTFTGQEAAYSPADSTSCTADGRAGVWLTTPPPPFSEELVQGFVMLLKIILFHSKQESYKIMHLKCSMHILNLRYLKQSGDQYQKVKSFIFEQLLFSTKLIKTNCVCMRLFY